MIRVDLSSEPRTPAEAVARARAVLARRRAIYAPKAKYLPPPAEAEPEPAQMPAHVAALLAQYRLAVDTGRDNRPSLRKIAKDVADKHGFTLPQLFGLSRNARICSMRHEFCYEARRLRPDLSLPAVGKFLGGRDHTTILNGIRKHAKRNGLPLIPGAVK